jgi:hypothetical protein
MAPIPFLAFSFYQKLVDVQFGSQTICDFFLYCPEYDLMRI